MAAPQLRIADDPTDPGGLASAPFDGEGSPARRNALIEDGRLATYLYDARTARKDGRETTASATRSSYRSPPSVGTSNLVIDAGESTLDELVRQAGDGLLVTDVAGLHSGVNPVSGTFSVGASGRLIEGGALGRPVREITIASDLVSMLKSVRAVGRRGALGALRREREGGAAAPRGDVDRRLVAVPQAVHAARCANFRSTSGKSGVHRPGPLLASNPPRTPRKEEQVTKSDFIDQVASESGLAKGEATKAVEASLKVIEDTLKGGGEINITGFGKFSVAQRGARQGVNPQTGERIQIAASKVPKFSAGSALKKSIKGT